MSHEPRHDVDERLAAYVDDCMGERERERFLAELRVNPQLRRDLEEYERTVAVVRQALRAPTARVSVADRVMAAIAADAPGPAAVVPGRSRRLLFSMFAAAALMMLAVWLNSLPQRTAPATVATAQREPSPSAEAPSAEAPSAEAPSATYSATKAADDGARGAAELDVARRAFAFRAEGQVSEHLPREAVQAPAFGAAVTEPLVPGQLEKSRGDAVQGLEVRLTGGESKAADGAPTANGAVARPEAQVTPVTGNEARREAADDFFLGARRAPPQAPVSEPAAEQGLERKAEVGELLGVLQLQRPGEEQETPDAGGAAVRVPYLRLTHYTSDTLEDNKAADGEAIDRRERAAAGRAEDRAGKRAAPGLAEPTPAGPTSPPAPGGGRGGPGAPAAGGPATGSPAGTFAYAALFGTFVRDEVALLALDSATAAQRTLTIELGQERRSIGPLVLHEVTDRLRELPLAANTRGMQKDDPVEAAPREEAARRERNWLVEGTRAEVYQLLQQVTLVADELGCRLANGEVGLLPEPGAKTDAPADGKVADADRIRLVLRIRTTPRK